jgi:hypothetical protein
MRSWIGSIASKLERARLMMRFNRKLKDKTVGRRDREEKQNKKKLQMRKRLLIDDINLRERKSSKK